MTDFAIPIVWPGYNIAVGDQQFTGLGHAGIVVVDGDTGLTRYFEYGRYDTDFEGNAIGEVRTRFVSNLSIDSDGIIDRSSLEIMVNNISNIAGQGTLAQGTIIALSDGGFEDAVAFAESAMVDEIGVLGEYSLNDNHCYSFAKDVAAAGGSFLDWFDGLWIFDNIPSTAMATLQSNYGGFSFGGNSTDYLFGGAARHVSEASECFGAGTPIDMWPLDPPLKPGPDGVYDQEAVRAGIWKKPIEEVATSDIVVSFDDKTGNLVPGKVTRTMTNHSKIILDFHGTFVTPGHVYWCAGGKFEGKYAPLIDIMRDDGVIQYQDGTLIRASTGFEVGTPDDEEFWAFLLYTEKGEPHNRVRSKTKLRFGTRWMTPDGNHFTMREYMDAIGVEIIKDRPQKGYARWKETGKISVFAWVLSDALPNPEDFILARSATSLEEIYKAGQWEVMRPQMPAPMVMDGDPVQPLPEHKLEMMPRNEPMAFISAAPSSEMLPGRKPTMNRKARKAAEARARLEAKDKRRKGETLH